MLTESLTEQFFAWEQLGRGWLYWGYPAALEPPFAAFTGYAPSPLPVGFDDGRKPTLLSSLAGRIRDVVAGSRRELEASGSTTIEIEPPEPYSPSSPFREI